MKEQRRCRLRAALTLDDATLNPQPKTGRPTTTAVGRVRHRDARVVLLRSVCALAALCLIGCATERFNAKRLPDELRAQPVVNPQTLDLSKIGLAAASDELIARGDVLEVSISAGVFDSQSTLPVRVDNSGNINLPMIGSVSVEGLDMETAESEIKLAGVNNQIYRLPPHVTVMRRKQQKNQVLVIGAVQNPDRYDLPRRSCDLLAAIYAAGGLADDAGTNVTIRYPGGVDHHVRQVGAGPDDLSTAGHSLSDKSDSPRSTSVNLVSAIESGTGGHYIQDRAIVEVERLDPMQVTVMGLVKKPDTYEFPATQEVRVSYAIAKAGGVSSILADKILVRRRLPHLDGPKVIQISLAAMNKDDSSDLILAPGDIVKVEQTPATVFLHILNIIRIGIGASASLF